MAKRVNNSKQGDSGEKMVKVPLRVNLETIEENGLVGQVSYVKIGYRKYPCIIGKVPESAAQAYMKMEWADVKAEERSNRCLIPDGKGGFIRCPEKNRCIGCEKVGRLDFDSMLPASLEALNEESDFEPEAPAVAEDNEDAAVEMMGVLIQRLGEISPRYADIFRELLNGEESPLHIAKALGLGKSQTYTDLPKVRKLAQDIYFELMGQ